MLLAAVMLMVLMAATIFATMRLWSAEASELTAELEVRAPNATCRRGVPAELCITLRNRSRLGWALLRVRASGGEALEVDPEWVPRLLLPRRSEVLVVYSLIARRTGRWHFWGVQVDAEDPFGLLRLSLWLPASCPVVVHPARTLHGQMPTSHALQRRARDVIGMHRRRRSGHSTEIREIRAYREGDPWKSIAWSASARRGSLQVREFEAEEAREAIVLLDISPTLRAGPHGAAFEYALDAVTGMLELMLAARDRPGLLTFGEAVHAVTAPGAGRRQRQLLLDHLIGLNTLVDPVFGDFTESEVLELIGRYLLLQERLDFRTHRTGAVGQFDEGMIERWLTATMEQERRRPGAPVLRGEPVGLSAARRFAWRNGLEIPARMEIGRVPREQAFECAFEEALRVSRRTRELTLVTDLAEIESLQRVEGLVGRLRANGRSLSVLVVDTAAFVTGGAVGNGPSIEGVLAWAEREEVRRVLPVLRRLGVPVTVGRPGLDPHVALMSG
ncbi:MAG: DUF58 domain-containing protein [Deltaproteobacteria bacterium]|nr:MAG: DUF58 domain-containing protein [Deltaproteobacteria bacterium]